MSVTEAALDVLADSTIDITRVHLPAGQLDRKTYVEVDKVLTLLGGKWNRKERAHLFAADPSQAIAVVLSTGEMPKDADKLASFFRTPEPIVARMLDWLAAEGSGYGKGDQILEPSAGDGAIAAALLARFPGAGIVTVEPDSGRAAELRRKGLDPWEMTFQEFAAGIAPKHAAIHAIVMNPPFTEPGKPMAWAEHVSLALTLLAPGGRLAAIVPSSIKHSTRAQAVRLRADIKRLGGSWTMLPEHAFRESGTDVSTALVAVTR